MKQIWCMLFGHVLFEQNWFSLTRRSDQSTSDKDIQRGVRVLCKRCGALLGKEKMINGKW